MEIGACYFDSNKREQKEITEFSKQSSCKILFFNLENFFSDLIFSFKFSLMLFTAKL